MCASWSVQFLGCSSGQASRTDGDRFPIGFDVSPDGEQIVFTSVEGDLFQLQIESGKVEQLLASPQIETYPVFSPDGSQIAFARTTPVEMTTHIFRLNIETKGLTQLTKGPEDASTLPRFSPDGKLIAFVRSHRYRPYSMGGKTYDDWDLYVMNADGNNPKRLTNEKYRQISRAAYLPDGESLLFSARILGAGTRRYSAIFRFSLDEDVGTTILTSEQDCRNDCAVAGDDPDVSPDGKSIVFVSDRGKKYSYDLYLMPVDGGNAKALNMISISKYNSSPRVSPDGSKVFFLASEQDGYGLWRVDSSGQNLKRVAGPELFKTPLTWKPSQTNRR